MAAAGASSGLDGEVDEVRRGQGSDDARCGLGAAAVRGCRREAGRAGLAWRGQASGGRELIHASRARVL